MGVGKHYFRYYSVDQEKGIREEHQPPKLTKYERDSEFVDVNFFKDTSILITVTRQNFLLIVEEKETKNEVRNITFTNEKESRETFIPDEIKYPLMENNELEEGLGGGKQT